MTMADKDAPSSRWIPWSFVGFFAVVFLANGIMLYFALSSWTGIATKDAFKKGLAYNERLAEAVAQTKLGWQLELRLPDRVGVEDSLDLAVVDSTGEPVDGAMVQARLVRPTHEGFDSALTLAAEGNGRYSGSVEIPLPGLWEVRLQIARQDDVYRHSERFQVQQ